MTGISKRFGATQALRNVNLNVAEGEVLALIGENGAGKSTLMKVLSGAHRPDSGQMETETRAWAASSSTSGAGEIPSIARRITRWNKGAAPVTPETSFMGVPSKLPAHTATVRSRVYPTVQLSE